MIIFRGKSDLGRTEALNTHRYKVPGKYSLKNFHLRKFCCRTNKWIFRSETILLLDSLLKKISFAIQFG